MNDSYEDESVISKDKYDKMKQASKLASNQESTDSKTSEKTSLPQSTTAQITPSINTSENHQPIIIKYQTQIFDKKGIYLLETKYIFLNIFEIFINFYFLRLFSQNSLSEWRSFRFYYKWRIES